MCLGDRSCPAVPFRDTFPHSCCSTGAALGGHRQHTLMNGSHDGLELFRMFPVFAGSQWVTTVALTGSEEEWILS